MQEAATVPLSLGCLELRSALCTHTHLLHAHFVWLHTAQSFHAWVHAWLKRSEDVKKVFAVSMSCLSISPSPLSCFTRPGLSRPKSAGPTQFLTGEEDFGYMANHTLLPRKSPECRSPTRPDGSSQTLQPRRFPGRLPLLRHRALRLGTVATWRRIRPSRCTRSQIQSGRFLLPRALARSCLHC